MRDKFFRKNVNRAVAIVLCIFAFIVAVAWVFMVKVTNIRNSFVSEIGVYTPSGVPDNYRNDVISIDIYQHWVYELNEYEQKAIEEDMKTGYWVASSYSVLSPFGFEPSSDTESECYACYYDVRNECFVTREAVSDTSPCVIFFYDAVTHYYYCIFRSF